VVVEKHPEEERAGKHTQVNVGNAEKDPIVDGEKQQQKFAHDGDRDGERKNPEKQLEVRVSRRHEGAPDLSRVEGSNPPPVPPEGQQAGQHAGHQEHMAENIPDFGYIDNPFTPWIMSHA
jgi:hypothetical protein